MKAPPSPSKVTALASGVLVGLVMPLQETLTKAFDASAQVQNIVFLFALTATFFGPVVLFVIGTRALSFGWRDLVARAYWAELRQITIRAIHWLIGVGVGFGILAALRL